MNKFSVTAAAILAAFAPSVVCAQEAAPNVRVTFETRDVGTPRLAARIERGIRRACSPNHFGGGLAAMQASLSCRDDLRRDARIKVAALESRVSATKLASVR